MKTGSVVRNKGPIDMKCAVNVRQLQHVPMPDGPFPRYRGSTTL